MSTKNLRVCPRCGLNNGAVRVRYCEGETWSIFNWKPCMLYTSHLHCLCLPGMILGGCGACWIATPLDSTPSNALVIS